MTRRLWPAVLLAAGLAGCGGPAPKSAPAPPPSSNPPADADVLDASPVLTPEPWARQPPGTWPQLVLTNKATFRGRGGLGGASAFLIRGEDGRTLAATARHLLGGAGGVVPEVPVEELERVLVSWRLHPRTQPDRFVTVARPLSANYDIVLLELKPQQGELPAQPLQVRTEPVRVGEKVYLVGCPYSEAGCRQNVYAGRVTQRLEGPGFLFDVSPPVVLRGFSGAPVLDEHGYAVAVLEGMSGDRTPDGRDRVGRAEELRLAFVPEGADAGVTLTPRAAEEVKRLIAQLGRPEMKLRLYVKPGGANALDLDANSGPGDWRTESRGVAVVIEPKDVPALRGAVVDFLPQQRKFAVTCSRPFRRR